MNRMTRTARMTDAVRTRAAGLVQGPGKTLAVSLGAAAVLAGTATGASAATLPGSSAHHAARPAEQAPPGLAPPGPATPLDQPASQAGITPAQASALAQPAAAPVTGSYKMYDSVNPSALPAGQAAAAYATGPYAERPSQVDGHPDLLWIDTNATDPHADVLDVEPGDATPDSGANWAWQRIHSGAGDTAIIYTMKSEWPATRAAVDARLGPDASQVKWWIADPTGTPHVVPGAQATQWYWGHDYDISAVTPALTSGS